MKRNILATSVIAFCLVLPAHAATASDATPFAQAAGGYAAHRLLNPGANWLLDRFDDFPSASLSSGAVVLNSCLVAAGTSLAVYGIGEAMEDTHGSLSYTLLGGVSAVGLCALAGALISQDDPLAGAAMGSVLGRYLAPIAATVAYGLTGAEDFEVQAPMVQVRF